MRTMIPGWLTVILAWLLAALPISAAEIVIQAVDLNGLACGECSGTVAVVIHSGGVDAAGETIVVELAVTQSELAPVSHSAQVDVGGASVEVIFDGVEISQCHLRPSSFEVSAARGGAVATRVSRAVITRRCPGGEGG